MANPITPEEVFKATQDVILPEVFEVINNLIVKEFDGGRAIVQQDDICIKIAEKLNQTQDEIFRYRLLNIEGMYAQAGWNVRYERPTHGDTWKAYFCFTPVV